MFPETVMAPPVNLVVKCGIGHNDSSSVIDKGYKMILKKAMCLFDVK